jgi:type I restriction enzyme S subunit
MRAGKFIKASDIIEFQSEKLHPCFGGNGLRGYTTSITHDGRYPLIGRQGAHCGNVHLFEGCFHATEHAIVADPLENSDSDWLYYALTLLNLNQFATGQAQPGLSVEVLERIPVLVPTSTEQQKIANCLGSLDDLIAAKRDKLAALQYHKKGLLQKLFPAAGQTTPELRFPGFEGEWEHTNLDKVCEMKAGKFVKASKIEETSNENLYPCYGGNGLRGYTKSFTHKGQYPLIGRQGAHCGNVHLVEGFFHATEHAIVADPSKKVISEWLFYALKLLNLNQFATGQAQPGLSVEVLARIPISVPTHQEQQKIADCLSVLHDLIAAQSDHIAALQEHKQGLMQQLFPNPDVPL